jgi:hypothetical protein
MQAVTHKKVRAVPLPELVATRMPVGTKQEIATIAQEKEVPPGTLLRQIILRYLRELRAKRQANQKAAA